MKVGDIVYAEHGFGAFWVGLVIEINDSDPDYFQCRVLWNDMDKTWEDLDCILTPEQKEDLEEMNESR
jgi:hypothetical protein